MLDTLLLQLFCPALIWSRRGSLLPPPVTGWLHFDACLGPLRRFLPRWVEGKS